jgi:hypothetical protein
MLLVFQMGHTVDRNLDVRTTTKRPPLSVVLCTLGDDHSRDRVSIGDLLMLLGDRALGALLFIFAFPNTLPTPPGTSTVLGAPLIFLAAQLAFAQRPWLPAFISRRSMSRDDYQTLIHRIGPWLARGERLLRPRLNALAVPPMEYIAGFVCFLLAIVMVLPIPFGNMLPALTISLIALGILEKDGVWILAGLVMGVVTSFVVSAVVIAMVKSVLFLIQQAL